MLAATLLSTEFSHIIFLVPGDSLSRLSLLTQARNNEAEEIVKLGDEALILYNHALGRVECDATVQKQPHVPMS